ncbi:hypothetical protein RRG08_065469 [Elysia crispata]|uniref:Uncharacterized protein n=1 Tax=Elysia crispata TaxID=231223 RepID=A0AAE1AQ21_9GAST|nr:hypothetical protein RRG08_065469 [Elysia crispata]
MNTLVHTDASLLYCRASLYHHSGTRRAVSIGLMASRSPVLSPARVTRHVLASAQPAGPVDLNMRGRTWTRSRPRLSGTHREGL